MESTPKDRARRIHKRLDDQDVLLKEIKQALVGDAFGNTGLVGRVAVNRTDIDKLKDQVDNHSRKLWLAGISLTAIWAAIVAFKDQIIGK